MITNGSTEDEPNVAKCSIKIVDSPESDNISIIANGKYDGVSFNFSSTITRTELAEANYNIMASKINKLSKQIRTLLERHIIDPVLKIERIYLPDGWSGYVGPDWLLEQKKSRDLATADSG